MICSLFSFVLSSITSQYMIIIFIKERILIPTHTLWFYFDYIVIIIHRIKDFYCMISYYIYTRMRAYMWMFMCVHADLVRRVRTTKTILALFCFFFLSFILSCLWSLVRWRLLWPGKEPVLIQFSVVFGSLFHSFLLSSFFLHTHNTLYACVCSSWNVGTD